MLYIISLTLFKRLAKNLYRNSQTAAVDLAGRLILFESTTAMKNISMRCGLFLNYFWQCSAATIVVACDAVDF